VDFAGLKKLYICLWCICRLGRYTVMLL